MDAEELAGEVLTAYRAGRPPGPDDAGPAVLARLVGDERALGAWLEGFGEGTRGIALYQGQAGFVAGVGTARARWPRLSVLADRAAESLAVRLSRRRWPREAVGWDDYDLITGPAGAVLALTTGGATRPDLLRAGAALLVRAAQRSDLDGLRVRETGPGEEVRGWCPGTVNTGVGHGVAGVAMALRAACEVPGAPRGCAPALARVAHWLVAEMYEDAWGVLTWPPHGREGGGPPAHPSRRQAWCYGTPGVSWALWEAGRVLGDGMLRQVASRAMASFCAAFDPERYLFDGERGGLDSLAICHGAAGTMLVADAFARHADLGGAGALRDLLETYLLDRLDQVPVLAGRRVLLLNGATGVLAALLTVRGGDRAWLAQYGLR
ncbi:lanthionine synthetase LanC family protein [Nonomuraea sp. NPDC050394]|uniref:lanthionine synthetase LanC family protein n=1 Tax=Nonomuraea sp. NPDC050394 TaxID=3364363 RepID=UPI00378D93C3